MTKDNFKELLEELDGNSLKTLIEKNSRYSSPDDVLHNFNVGADIMGGTPAQACWGYLTKHLVALRDMVERDDFSNKDDLLEKCQDAINYIRFLWCIGNDKTAKNEDENSQAPMVRYICKTCGADVGNNRIDFRELRTLLIAHMIEEHATDVPDGMSLCAIIDKHFNRK